MTTLRAFSAFVIAALLVLVASDTRADEKNPFDVRDTTLPNGLHVVTDHVARVPLVSVVLAFRVGTGEEPANRVGINNLTLSLMTHRTKHLRDGELTRQLDALATTWRWEAGLDYAFIAATVPPQALERMMWLFSDMTGFFVESLDQAEVDREVANQSSQKAHRQDMNGGLVGQLVYHALFPEGHAYHRLADDPQIHAVTVAEIAAHHRRWFVPRNAYLSVTGMFDPDEMLRLATKYFATIPGGDPPPRQAPARPSLAGETRIEVAAPVSSPYLSIQWPTVRHFTAGDGELDAVANILDGTRSAQLTWEVDAKKHLVSSISAGQHSWRDASVFQITATLLPGHTASEVVDAVDVVMRDLLKSAPDADDVRAALLPMLLNHAFGYERSYTRAYRYVDWMVTTGEPAAALFSKQFGRYEFDSARMIEVAKHELPLDRRVVSVVVPDPNAPLHGVLRNQTFKPAVTP